MQGFYYFKLLLLLSLSVLASACGSGGSDNSPKTTSPIKTASIKQNIRVFDFVYGGSDYSTVHFAAYSNSENKHMLTPDFWLFGSSSSSQYHYEFKPAVSKQVTVELIDRNTQVVHQQVKIPANETQAYWVFAFGNTLNSDYTLYSVPRPKLSKTKDTVPLYLIDALTPDFHSQSDIYLNGKRVVSDLNSTVLSKPLILSTQQSLINIEVQRQGKVIHRCSDIQPSPNSLAEYEQQQWHETPWILVFAPDQRCYLYPVDLQQQLNN
ncbi:hypothetical protein [Shewanella waksmanii]|uniref:hypothetical protein n=1 Tax=Shewanella waksmanii TaxID=213783 RepID=UPI0037354060